MACDSLHRRMPVCSDEYRKSQKAKMRLEGHLDAFSVMWHDAAFVMHEAKLYKSLVAFEWPTFCAYWQRGRLGAHD